MRQKLVDVYKASELDGRALDNAYHNWIDSVDYHWSGENVDTLKAFEKVFPVNVRGWEYDTVSGHVSWEFDEDNTLRYDEVEELSEMSGLRLAKYIWNNYKNDILKGKFYHTGVGIGKGTKTRYSKIQLERSCPLTGYCMDEEILDPIFKFLDNPEEGVTFEDLMSECIDSWIIGCVNDFDHCTSMKYFIEESDELGWEYDENGKMI